MGHHMGPVGILEILFWVDPPRGGIILEKLKKSKLSPYGPGRTAESFCGTFCSTFAYFFIFLGKFGYFFEWAERSEAGQQVVIGLFLKGREAARTQLSGSSEIHSKRG